MLAINFGHHIFSLLLSVLISAQLQLVQVRASSSMKRLYEELFTDYNRLIIPIALNKTRVTVTLGLKLGQILDLNLKQQILSTNVWVEQTWHDRRLEWDPQQFGGIDMIHVPAENIWIPDIVLFNNADGNYELTLVAKAVLYSNGTVVWKPPTMFRSTCEIDVEYFPFDIQTCFLRFGSWTYAGDEVEIRHVSQKKRKVDIGIDLSQFYKNVEWDIIDVPAYYNENYYECCQEPYPDITFKIVIRRKMLFYLVNLILPVALMTFMTVSVFYLPADSNEKVTLSISILTSLIVFFLLMLEIIPPTSLAVPLFGKYLLFTLVLVSLSACVSVYVLNIYHRAPSVHQMSPRMRQLFLKTLPRLLRLDRPDPRERSSLNRFRKKKIAQQIVEARQHNKVYDLAQPLAASLNLIETLHKSYAFNQDDDKAKSGSVKQNFMSLEDDEEGRYFRKYVDNYIEQLQTRENNSKNSSIRNQERIKQTRSGHSNQQGAPCRQCSNSMTNSANSQQQRCCEHQRCCRNAYRAVGQRPSQQLNSGQHPDWTTESSDIMRPLVSSATNRRQLSNQCNACMMSNSSTHLAHHQSQFGILNDDTLDMTFDYDDQEEVGFVMPAAGNVGQSNRNNNRADEIFDELPSPPPPPKQLTQLSDSLRDLSGRVSTCSAPQQRPKRMPSGQDDRQLVDKLISSINLINNASDEIDTTTSVASSNSVVPGAGFLPQSLNETNLRGGLLPNSASDNYLRRRLTNMQPLYDSSLEHDRSVLNERQSSSNAAASIARAQRQAVFCTCTSAKMDRRLISNDKSCNCCQGPMFDNSQLNERKFKQTSTQSTQHLDCKEDESENLDGNFEPSEILLSLRLPYDQMPAHVRAAIRSILFIADTIKNEDDENSAIEDWESVSMVVDRLFLWIFFLLCTFGSLIILALAPSLYDQRDSIDDKLRIEIPSTNCTALN